MSLCEVLQAYWVPAKIDICNPAAHHKKTQDNDTVPCSAFTCSAALPSCFLLSPLTFAIQSLGISHPHPPSLFHLKQSGGTATTGTACNSNDVPVQSHYPLTTLRNQ